MARPAAPMFAPETSRAVCAEGAFSPDAAAAFVSLSRDVIDAAVEAGELEAFKFGRRVLIAKVRLVEWLAAVRDRSIREGTARNVNNGG